MLNLKKTAAAVLALSSSAAFAGTMGPVCSAVNVTVPCESTAWDVGARALYLQPSFAGGTYSYAGVNQNNNLVSYDDAWGWGFMIEGSYHFETGSDANLNWYHFAKNSTGSHNGTQTMAFGNTITVTSADNGTHAGDPSWDAVNLEFGQHVDFGEKKSIRFHGGAQYGRIANQITINNTTTETVTLPAPIGSSASTGTVSLGSKTVFNGFGPRVGADMDYAWGNGLSVYANGAAALLAGSTKLTNTNSSTISGVSRSRSLSKDVVAPELEAKLGIKYDYAVAQGDLTFDAGWMWVNYWNVAQSENLPIGTPNVNSVDFSVQGLYFGLKWMGNVA